MNWLLKLDPDTVVMAISLMSSVGGWIWHKIRGETQQSFRSVIGSVVDNLIFEVLDNDEAVARAEMKGYLRYARDYVTKHAWDVFAKRGVPRNAATERLFNEAIEAGVKRVQAEILARRARAKPGS